MRTYFIAGFIAMILPFEQQAKISISINMCPQNTANFVQELAVIMP